jgi:hypothetical protein
MIYDKYLARFFLGDAAQSHVGQAHGEVHEELQHGLYRIYRRR